MTITSADIGLYRTNPSLSSGWSGTQTNPAASLGKYISTTAVTSGSVGDLFDEVSATAANTGQTDYRCVGIRNLSGADTMTNTVVYLDDPAGGGTYTIGKDPVGVVTYNTADAQGTYVASKTTAPAGVTFTAPTSADPITVGDMSAGKVQLVWIKRVITAGTAGTVADLCNLSVRAEV